MISTFPLALVRACIKTVPAALCVRYSPKYQKPMLAFRVGPQAPGGRCQKEIAS